MGESLQCVPPIPRVSAGAMLKVVNQTSWRSGRLQNYLLERYDVVNHDLCDDVAQQEVVATVTSDNVPSLAKHLRHKWLDTVRTTVFRVLRTSTAIPIVRTNFRLWPAEGHRDMKTILKSEAPLFGVCPEVEVARQDYTRFQFSGGFKAFLRRFYPRIATYLQRFGPGWHMSEMLDYLGGKVALAPTVLHPALTHVLSLAVAVHLKPRHRGRRCMSFWLGSLMEPLLLQSDLARRVYSW